MKAIILAAGKGTRLKPITYKIPKPLIKINNKTIIEYSLENIYNFINEIIIIVKYKKEEIKKYLGDNYKGIKITYKTQSNEYGTGAAIKGIYFDDDILILNGDTIYDKNDLLSVIKFNGYGVLAKKVNSPEKYGIFETDNSNKIKQIVEKPQKFIGNHASLGLYKFNSSILKYVNEIQKSERGEYELTDALNLYVKENNLYTIESKGKFIDIGNLDDIYNLNQKYFNKNFKNPELGDFYALEKIDDLILGIGLPKSEIENIIKYSKDKNDISLQKNTSDSKRFKSYKTLEKWYNDKGRIVFSLISKKGDIAGFYQLRPAKFPNIIEITNKEFINSIDKNNIHTSGIRIYPKFRGKGLAGSLIGLANIYYKKLHGNFYLSIDIKGDNISSIKSFERASFTFVGYGENIKSVGGESKKRMVYIKEI